MPKEFLVSLLVLLLFVAGSSRPGAGAAASHRGNRHADSSGNGRLRSAARAAGSAGRASAGRPRAPTDRWIVQFHAPLTRSTGPLLTRIRPQARPRTFRTWPISNAFRRSTLERLRQSELVRAIVAYQPAFKISPRIGRFLSAPRSGAPCPACCCCAVLFDDVDPQQRSCRPGALPGVTAVQVQDLRRRGGPARIEFQLASRTHCPRSLGSKGVRWIEEVAERIEDNGNSAGTIQSGTPGNEPVWDRGIHGEGQIVGVIDSGPLDINHCMFRDPVNNTPSADPPQGARHPQRGGPAATPRSWRDRRRRRLQQSRHRRQPRQRLGGAPGVGRQRRACCSTPSSPTAPGARIHTNSWHDDTAGSGNPATYNQTAADVDTFTWNNAGPPGARLHGQQRRGAGPARHRQERDRRERGAARSERDERGRRQPRADRGRPAQAGHRDAGLRHHSAVSGTACGVQTWPGNPNVCATSWATPAAAATAALIRQYYTEGWYPTGTARPAER